MLRGVKFVALALPRICSRAFVLSILASTLISIAAAEPARDAQQRLSFSRTALRTAQPIAPVNSILPVLTSGAFSFNGKQALPQRPSTATRDLSESQIVSALRGSELTPDQSAALWATFADLDNRELITLPIVQALLSATSAPKAREAMWGELAELARDLSSKEKRSLRQGSLLGLFEQHRDVLLPLLSATSETPSSCDDMITLMVKSRIFGPELEDSVSYVSERIPAAVARHIERERGLGHPVSWEYVAFEAMMRWKAVHLLPGAGGTQTAVVRDAAGEAFITIFNCLHGLDEGYREVILRGLGPIELFNAVVAGEKELYRLGTSGYRDFIHTIIMRGIHESGSFEAFIDVAVPAVDGAPRHSGHSGLVFLRIASSFGLLDPVLQTVKDQERFIATVMTSLNDPSTFPDNSSVVIDVLTAHSHSSVAPAFKRALTDRLYARYREESRTALKKAYGTILSVYQTITGEHRERGIDRDFPLDESVFHIPFDRLFTAESDGRFVHRMFMRMDDNEDASNTYDSFLTFAKSLSAEVEKKDRYSIFKFEGTGRSIEIYVNEPSPAGVKTGIDNIATALRGRRIETVIGRGHTSIIAPLQTDAKRLLGARVHDVATVIVGACGGDVSVRELIATFGYVPIIATKATGRQVINNAIIRTYLKSLFAMPAGGQFAVTDVLDRTISAFTRDEDNGQLGSDASHYDANMPAVLSARLYDAHVRAHLEPQPERRAALD